ncbi:SRPBCC family protein [bacterium]|nr:SRPBCC family protein [bacterium]
MSDSTTNKMIVTERLIHFPVETVWKAWSDPQYLAQWWGPKDFTNTFNEFDFKPGGHWRFVMHGPNGSHYPNESQFIEIVTNQRIIFRHQCIPFFLFTATFEKKDRQTHITWQMEFDTVEECERVKKYAGDGNEQNLDRLENLLRTIG